MATPGKIEVSRQEATRSEYDQRTGSRRFWFIAASILGLLLIGWMFREPIIDQVAVQMNAPDAKPEYDAPVESGRDAPLVAAAGGQSPSYVDPIVDDTISMIESDVWKEALESAKNSDDLQRIAEDRMMELKNRIVELDPSGNLTSERTRGDDLRAGGRQRPYE